MPSERSGTDVDKFIDRGRDAMVGLLSDSSADWRLRCGRMAVSSLEPRCRERFEEDDDDAVEPEEDEGCVACPCLAVAREGWKVCCCW